MPMLPAPDWRHAVPVSQSDIKKKVLSNLVHERLTDARLATPGYLDVRPSPDDEFDVEVSISPLNRGTAEAIKALVQDPMTVTNAGSAPS
jgi:hypothetical protein